MTEPIIASVDTNALRQYIRDSGVKQTWLAARTSMTVNALTLAINNKRAFKAGEYTEVCTVLEVPLDRFLRVNRAAAAGE